jgi:hypothetical protein
MREMRMREGEGNSTNNYRLVFNLWRRKSIIGFLIGLGLFLMPSLSEYLFS